MGKQSKVAGVPVALTYTRVSTEDQGREGLSLPAQVDVCRQYAQRQGWTLGQELSDVMSGAKDDRPGYVALLVEAKRLASEGQRPVVVVAWLHRLGRRLRERVRAWEELQALGVEIHSVHEGGLQREFVFNILASVAQEETRQLGERISATWAGTTANGWFKGGQPPFGYRWRPATTEERAQGAPRSVIEVNPLTAPYIRQAFERLARGEGTRSVQRWLASLPLSVRTLPRSEVFAAKRKANGHDVRTDDLRYDFAQRSVMKMLRSPVYAGRHVHGDDDALSRPRARWDAIVDDTLWESMQRRLSGNGPTSTRASQKYLLTGLLVCPKGHAAMRGGSLPDSPRYRCAGQDERGFTCTETAQRDLIDQAVLEHVGAIVEAVASDPRVQAGLRTAWKALGATDRDQAERRRLEGEIAQAQARRSRAGEYLLDQTMTKADYAVAIAKADEQEQAARDALAKLRASERASVLPALDEVLRQAAGWAAVIRGADVAVQRRVLAVLVERVVPIRVKRGVYEPEITWTPLGRLLAQVAG